MSNETSIALSQLAEGQLHAVPLPKGRKAIVVREGGRVSVFSEVCPHMGADLAEATYCSKERTLRCRWHGYLFASGDGRMLDNPNDRLMTLLRKPSEHYKPEKAPAYKLKALPFEIRGDRVVILAGAAEETNTDTTAEERAS